MAKTTTKKTKKHTKIKIKCGWGGDLLYLLCLISNTLPQLVQSSLQPSTVLHHRHLLQTTSYNHLLLLHHHISRKEKTKQQQARNPLSLGVEKPEWPSALQPTTESSDILTISRETCHENPPISMAHHCPPS